jgi:hypothetical protein
MDCMILEWPTFVLQRRINVAPVHVLRVALDRRLWGRGAVLAHDHDGALQLDAPLRLVDAGRLSVWRAPGRLLTIRGRTVGLVEIEIGLWSPHDTELLVRPRARHPERWSRRRQRRYFVCAHRRADQLTCMLSGIPTEPDVPELLGTLLV